jgi:hypothetical protein
MLVVSFERDWVQLCQLVERQFRFPIRQWESDNNILTAKLTPKRIRGPFLRLWPAQTLDPNKIPFRHKKRPKTRTLQERALSCLSALANTGYPST